jgi:HPt (histidine-containing phosphotransfer) domain-containing protein
MKTYVDNAGPVGLEETFTGNEILERSILLNPVAGDLQRLRYLVRLFLLHSPGLMAALRQAISAGSCETLRSAAKKMKGALAQVGGYAPAVLAQRLENMGSECDLTAARNLFARLEAEVDRLRASLAEAQESTSLSTVPTNLT